MDRREALQLTVSLLGTSVFGAQVFLSGCTTPKTDKSLLDESDLPLLNTLADIILPETKKSPGAKEANVGSFILSIVRDCYSVEEANIFNSGIRKLEENSISSLNMSFLEWNTKDQIELLTAYDREAIAYEDRGEPHFFSMLLQLTIWGYFVSEPGATQALRYNPVPGRFDGCVPYSREQSAWA